MEDDHHSSEPPTPPGNSPPDSVPPPWRFFWRCRFHHDHDAPWHPRYLWPAATCTSWHESFSAPVTRAGGRTRLCVVEFLWWKWCLSVSFIRTSNPDLELPPEPKV